MDTRKHAHLPAMIHRAVLGLATATCLLACLGKTTSLGGPSGNQASATSTSGDDGGDAGQPITPGAPWADAGSAGSAGLGPACHGYSWDPIPSSVACEYLLPAGKPPNDDSRLDPAFWNPDQVTVDIIIPQKWREGLYVTGGASRCGTSDGWYYVDAASGKKPTLFALCPTSCASITNEAALLRLTAITYCE
jgi:hypothetical protein